MLPLPVSRQVRQITGGQASPHQKFKRLIRTSDYKRAYRQGERVRACFTRLYIVRNAEKCFRLGVVVSKRVSKKAVERNWHRRVIKEWFRQHAVVTSREYSDIVIVVTSAVRTTPPGSAELRKELAALIQQIS